MSGRLIGRGAEKIPALVVPRNGQSGLAVGFRKILQQAIVGSKRLGPRELSRRSARSTGIARVAGRRRAGVRRRARVARVASGSRAGVRRRAGIAGVAGRRRAGVRRRARIAGVTGRRCAGVRRRARIAGVTGRSLKPGDVAGALHRGRCCTGVAGITGRSRTGITGVASRCCAGVTRATRRRCTGVAGVAGVAARQLHRFGFRLCLRQKFGLWCFGSARRRRGRRKGRDGGHTARR